jgi:hypothetical protein
LNANRVASSAGHVVGTANLMLIELEKVRGEALTAMCAMDAATSESVADRYRVSKTRWRLSQAGLRGCTAGAIIFQYLLPRVDPVATEALRLLQRDHMEVLKQSTLHIGLWTLDRIEADWRGYCQAYRTIRLKMTTYIIAEKRILCTMLKEEALGGIRCQVA